MIDVVDDLNYLEYCAEELESYLLAKDLFWPVLVQPEMMDRSFPKMTIGNILLALQRLDALSLGRQLSGEETSRYQRLKTEVEAVQSKWLVAWESKAAHEYHSRFKQWAETLDEVFKNREKQAAFYTADVRLRVLLALLENHVPTDEMPELQPLDTMLRAVFVPGAFIWDEELRPGFPEDRFWFMYGSIRTD